MPAVAPELRVLQVGPLYNNHLRRWSSIAVALGCRVYAAGHVRPGRRRVDLADIAEHVEVAPESLWGCGTARRVAWLRDILRTVEPDLVQAHWLPTWGYYTALSGHRPFVVTAWGSDVYLAGGAERRRADLALRSADAVLARSAHMLRELVERGASPERTHHVQLGVDLQRFRPASAGEQARARQELGLPRGPVILSFRAGTDLYNLDVVLEAFGILHAQLPDATLVLVHGDAPLSRRVRVLLQRPGGTDGIRVVGHVAHADMPRYLRAATVGVSIPDSDGSPNSVWEALACGLPLILSDLPQLAERVGRSGAVNLIDAVPEAVAAALHEVVAHPGVSAAMARAARAWAVANADQREQAARLESVYVAMAARRVPRPAQQFGAVRAGPRARGRARVAAVPRSPS